MTKRFLAAAVVLVSAAGAAAPSDVAEPTQQALSSCAPRLVQAGSAQQLLGVTADDHVLYQEGTEVYASALTDGTPRQRVASVPAGNFAFVWISGKVAFVWSNPERNKPGFGVSPLWVWSAASGAHFASDSSPIGTFATAASSDGRSVMYPTRGNPTSGDLEVASVDLSSRTTIAAGIPMGFPFGPCRPWASFLGHGGSAHPVALYCRPGETTATLSSWRGGAQKDLLSGVATPPFFTADKSGTTLFTTLASPSTAVLVSEDAPPVVVDQSVTRTGFISGDSVVYIGVAGTQRPLKRFDVRTGERTTLVPHIRGVLTTRSGSDLITQPWGSPDRKKLAYFINASNAGVDQNWVDMRGEQPPVVIDAQPRNYGGVPNFTADSKQFLFARPTDAANGLAAIFAQDGTTSRQLTDDRAWSYAPATGSDVSYLDNFDLGTFTGDLKVVDVSRQTLEPRLIATGVDANVLPSPDGRLLVYTRNGPGVTAGTYVVRAQP
jgi:hypothetical protein